MEYALICGPRRILPQGAKKPDGDRRMTIRKAIAMILVIALLGAGVWYLHEMEEQDQRHMQSIYTSVEPLQRERDALIQERDGLELNYALMMRDVATVQLLFREMRVELFTDVYPIMRERGITGILGLSDEEYPGYGGRINVTQYGRLMMDGWSSCYIYTFKSTAHLLDTWLVKLENRLDSNGFAHPTAIYFPNDVYLNEYDEILLLHGIQTVITDAEDGHSSTVTDMSGDIWFTGAMPWNYTGVSSDIDLLARTDGANITFTISFSNIWDTYEKASFTSMMDNWSSVLYVDDPLNEAVPQPAEEQPADEQLQKPLLRVCDYAVARSFHQVAAQNNAVYRAEFQKRQTELDNRIAELDEQIRALYDQWQK